MGRGRGDGERQRGWGEAEDLGGLKQEEATGHTASEQTGDKGEAGATMTAGFGLGTGCAFIFTRCTRRSRAGGSLGTSTGTYLVERGYVGLMPTRPIWSRNTEFGFSSQRVMRRMRSPKGRHQSGQNS